MNHLVLPDTDTASDGRSRVGTCAMETLLRAIVRERVDRSRLLAKVFGGAKMITGLSDAGLRNARFVLAYLDKEQISCNGQSLGGILARQIEFWPSNGRARVRFLEDSIQPVMTSQPPTG